MTGKDGFDTFAVGIKLELKDSQLLATRHGEEAFSRGELERLCISLDNQRISK